MPEDQHREDPNSNQNDRSDDVRAQTQPERVRTEPYRDDYYADEISLRDLYLILKRGMPLIIGVALVAGVVGFLGASLRPKSYEAEATVLSSPSAVRVRDEGTLAFEPTNSVSFQAYETIAMSRAVFEETVARLDGTVEELPGYRDLQSAAGLEQLTGPDRAGQVVPLTVLHRISWTDPETAATYTNAWAKVTVDTMRSTLLANLDPVQAVTSSSTSSRLDQLEELEARLQEFQARDNTAELEASLEELHQEIAEGERRQNELISLIQVEEARGVVLASQMSELGASTPDADPISDAFLAGNDLATARTIITDQLTAAEERRAEAQAALDAFDRANPIEPIQAEVDFLLGNTRAPIVLVSGEGADMVRSLPDLRQRLRDIPRRIAVLEAKIASGDPASDALRAELAGLTAEREALAQQIEDSEALVSELQTRLTILESERGKLEAVFATEHERYRDVLLRSREVGEAQGGNRVIRESTAEAAQLRTNLRGSELALEALRTEQSALQAQLGQTREQVAAFRSEASSLARQRSTLERQLELAQAAYLSVAQLEPLIDYVTELTPSSTRVINTAAAPVSPSGPGATLVAILAIVLGGMLATLFVFLREAVRSPDETRGEGMSSGTAPAHA